MIESDGRVGGVGSPKVTESYIFFHRPIFSKYYCLLLVARCICHTIKKKKEPQKKNKKHNPRAPKSANKKRANFTLV